MTEPVMFVNYIFLFVGACGFLAYPVLEHFYDREVSGSLLAALLGIAFTAVLLGAGIWVDGVDLVPVRALAALSLTVAEIAVVQLAGSSTSDAA
ncbi:hypothetical protein [Haloferax sp. ATB1]|uniref:hypothetical protein n=1 Tax=Haloferax sp. ATB1 TaxID=1508454 RepID=UPI0005B1F11B|nr:hypothetical protein [Haloferax sp. ATB1]